nr:sensor histidine kinase [Chitinophagaceae bacterium]
MATSLLKTRKNKFIFSGCWGLWTIVQYTMLQNFDIDWKIAAADSVFSNALLAGASMLVINSLAYYRPEKRKYLYLLAWCSVLSILWVTIFRYGMLSVFHGNTAYMNFLDKSMAIRLDIAFLITGCASITSMLW